jgi:hypothetical protein
MTRMAIPLDRETKRNLRPPDRFAHMPVTGPFLQRARSTPVGAASVALEVLHRALMLLGRRARLECAEVAPAPGLRVGFARIKPVSAGFELADHRRLHSSGSAEYRAVERATSKSQNSRERTQFQQGCGAFSAKVFSAWGSASL